MLANRTTHQFNTTYVRFARTLTLQLHDSFLRVFVPLCEILIVPCPEPALGSRGAHPPAFAMKYDKEYNDAQIMKRWWLCQLSYR